MDIWMAYWEILTTALISVTDYKNGSTIQQLVPIKKYDANFTTLLHIYNHDIKTVSTIAPKVVFTNFDFNIPTALFKRLGKPKIFIKK